jgi:hypothetical protein
VAVTVHSASSPHSAPPGLASWQLLQGPHQVRSHHPPEAVMAPAGSYPCTCMSASVPCSCVGSCCVVFWGVPRAFACALVRWCTWWCWASPLLIHYADHLLVPGPAPGFPLRPRVLFYPWVTLCVGWWGLSSGIAVSPVHVSPPVHNAHVNMYLYVDVRACMTSGDLINALIMCCWHCFQRP